LYASWKELIDIFFLFLTRPHTNKHGKEKELMSVVLNQTMKRVFKHYTGLKRIENEASKVGCHATDQWIANTVERVLEIATSKKQRTIDKETVAQALGKEADDLLNVYTNWCKTRLRDRVKLLTPGFRWSLAAKKLMYNAFEAYIRLLSARIEVTQFLCGLSTISAKHVKAAIECR
jgi:histone H3/H4